MRPKAPLTLKLMVAGVLAFLYIPFGVILLYAFTTEDAAFTFPPPGLTLDWFGVAWGRADMWPAFWLSVQVAAVATIAGSRYEESYRPDGGLGCGGRIRRVVFRMPS